MNKRLDKFTAYALKVSGAKQVLSNRKKDWPKKLKLKAIDEAIKIAKVRPGVEGEVLPNTNDGGLDFCAIGCLGVVVGEPIKTSIWPSGRARPMFTRLLRVTLSDRSFSGDSGGLIDMTIQKNDEGTGNSTVKALRWLKKQIEKT